MLSPVYSPFTFPVKPYQLGRGVRVCTERTCTRVHTCILFSAHIRAEEQTALTQEPVVQR